MTSTAKPAQRTFRLWARMALLPVLLVSLLAAFGYSGTLSARDLLLESDSAIDNTGGEIRARRILHLKSGGDIINDSTTSSTSGSSANSAYRKETIDRRGRIILDGEGGEEDNSKGGMHLYAGENIESRTGDIENRNSGSQSILSGKNVHFDIRTLDNRFTLNSGGESRLGAPGREYLSTRVATDHGSHIQGKGDIFIHAREGKVHGRGMQINSDDGIVAIYGRDGVDLHNGWEERDLISSQYHKGRRIIGRKENETYREEHSKSAIPGLISGKRVAIVAGYDPENQTKQNGHADVNLTGIYAVSDNGTLLKASHDIKLNAAENTLLSNNRHYSQKSGPTLKISHGTLMAGYRDDKGWNDQKILSHSYNGVILGATQGDVTLAADNDIHTHGAQAVAGQDIKLYAKRIHIGVAQGEDQYSENSRGQSKGFRMGVALRPPEIRAADAYIKGYQAGKGKGLQGHQSGMDTATFQSTQAFFESPIQSDATRSDYNGQNSGRIGTNSGSNFIAKGKIHAVASESDIDVIGSRLFGQQGIELDAARDINIFAADGRRYHRSSSEQHGKGIILGKSSGFIGSTQSNTQSQNTQGELQASSLDSGGQIDIKAGRNYTQLGSRVQNSAGHNINITAQKINVVAASGDYSGSSSQDYRRKGFNIAGNNPSLDSLQAAANAARQGGQSDNRLIKVAATANSAMHSYQAAQQLSEAPNGGGLNIKIAYGQEHSHAEQQYSGNSLLPSTIAAGGKLNLTATGAGEASDINIIASDVYGSSGTHLKADHKINLLAGTENHQEQSSSYSNSWESGVALSVGGGAALGVTASTAESQQQAQGQQSHWRHSHVGTFDSHTTLESGDATTFKGAQALGQGVSVKAASLHIESLQDSGSYSGSAHSSGAGGTVGLGYAAGNAHYTKSRAQSDYRSIGTASGIYAGDDGFQVDIKGHTQLIGGTIAGSEAAEAAGKNSFVTGTLQLQDLQNHSHSSGSGISLAGGYSYDAKSAEPNRFNKSMGAIKSNTHENGTTHASINTANITIRDNDAQQALTGESVAETAARANLGMWTENAQAQDGAVARPDGQKLLQEMQIGAEVGREFGSMAPQYIALLAEKQGNLRKHEQNLLAQELDQRLLAETTDPVKQQTIRDRMNNRAQDISANQRAYDAWKEGGILRNATHGLTSFVGSGGAPDAALAGYTTSVLSPVLNKQNNPLLDFAAGPLTGALLGGGNPGAIAAGANTDWHNRLLHPSEKAIIKDLAQRLAEANVDNLNYSEPEWQNILEITAAAMVDEENNQELNRELSRPAWHAEDVYHNEPKTLSLGPKYVYALMRARQILESEANKNVPISWKDGTTIKAYGEDVKRFQATMQQYQDHTLFGIGKLSIPIDDDLNDFGRYKKFPAGGVFGDNEANYIKEINDFSFKGVNIHVRKRMNQAYYDYTGTGEVEPVYPEFWLPTVKPIISGTGKVYSSIGSMVHDIRFAPRFATQKEISIAASRINEFKKLGNSKLRHSNIGYLEGTINGKNSTTNFELVGTPYLKQSPNIERGTTVKLSQPQQLANGEILPKGSVVTTSDNMFKARLPDGTIKKGNVNLTYPQAAFPKQTQPPHLQAKTPNRHSDPNIGRNNSQYHQNKPLHDKINNKDSEIRRSWTEAEKISTAKAKAKQSAVPRDLNEHILFEQVKRNPSAGKKLAEMNSDPRFQEMYGFKKMQVTHELPDGNYITIHYQYNKYTNKAYDIKVVTPQRLPTSSSTLPKK